MSALFLIIVSVIAFAAYQLGFRSGYKRGGEHRGHLERISRVLNLPIGE